MDEIQKAKAERRVKPGGRAEALAPQKSESSTLVAKLPNGKTGALAAVIRLNATYGLRLINRSRKMQGKLRLPIWLSFRASVNDSASAIANRAAG